MPHETEVQIVEDLNAILEKERSALLLGEIAMMTSLITEKERLVNSLNALDKQPIQGLNNLHQKLLRNQALLNGTLQGIRTVTARLAAHRRIRRSMDTYDQHGRKLCILGEITHNVEKHA